MNYRVELRPAAQRQLRSLTPQLQRRLQQHIDALVEEPRPSGARRLAGPGALHRLRVGDYRIIYTIADQIALVTVTTIGHRREIYR